MARIRTIKPDFFRHHKLYLAEMETGLPLRVAFAGLWTAADREGRFRWIPEQLKLDCLPYDNLDFSRVLDALMTRGFIIQYGSNGAVYGCIPSWNRHQVINNRERASEIPSPEESEILTRAPRDDDACPTPLMHAQGEGKGKEWKGKEQERTNTRCVETGMQCRIDHEKCLENFNLFWAAYPRHAPSRKEALKSWCKAQIPNDQIETLLAWIKTAKQSEQWREPSKIPHATTWLNQQRWTGDPPPPPQRKGIFDFLKEDETDGE